MSIIKSLFQSIYGVFNGLRVYSSNEAFIDYLRKQGIRIGEHVNFQVPRTLIMDFTRPWLIEIGNNVVFCSYFTILAHGYDWCVLQKQDGELFVSAGKVTIGNNVFIGSNVTILKGVSVGDNVIIGACSLVNKDLPSNGVYAGNPARRICSLDEYREKRRSLQYEEAKIIVTEYYKAYGKPFPKEEAEDFFWLFTHQDEVLPERYAAKLKLKGNEIISREWFKKQNPMFHSYEDFLASCGIIQDES